ncbi:hypothetical protein [Desulfurobacterium sp.]
MNSLLENAISSIQLGIEDYKMSAQDPKRVISAIRNIYAGVLLLFKEKLARLSPKEFGEPPILIRKKLKLELEITSNGLEIKKEKNTVNYDGIKERFKALGIEVDWRRLDRARSIRNDIEHYKLNLTPKEVEETIWILFPVIQDFIKNHLDNKKPSELLGIETWQTLLETEETYQKELDSCLKEIEKKTKNPMIKAILKSAIKSGDLKCPYCQSLLIKPTTNISVSLMDTKFSCSYCGEVFALSERDIEEFLESLYLPERYTAIKEGGEDPIKICSECGRDSVIYDEEGGEYICLLCGSSFKYICERCQQLYNDEDDIGICPDCYREILEKD